MARLIRERVRRWRCVLCPEHGTNLDPRQALEDHYYETHHTPAPF